ncbi:unnamed protein product [Microthlaspi erraticum]|uniref:Uncharacterized protein n=1 Tax=Microthlaspi erraticum TaxID=1685480 RepID=A0A6D2JN26_9BRAS|nr:unnamed protein product [Microthlaspi erraticum]
MIRATTPVVITVDLWRIWGSEGRSGTILSQEGLKMERYYEIGTRLVWNPEPSGRHWGMDQVGLGLGRLREARGGSSYGEMEMVRRVSGVGWYLGSGEYVEVEACGGRADRNLSSNDYHRKDIRRKSGDFPWFLVENFQKFQWSGGRVLGTGWSKWDWLEWGCRLFGIEIMEVEWGLMEGSLGQKGNPHLLWNPESQGTKNGVFGKAYLPSLGGLREFRCKRDIWEGDWTLRVRDLKEIREEKYFQRRDRIEDLISVLLSLSRLFCY